MRHWRAAGAFTAFLVALFTEMYGIALTIYLIMLPILVAVYACLTRSEEREVAKQFGEQWAGYGARTPAFLPCLGRCHTLRGAERPTRLAAINAHQSCAYRTGTLVNRASSAEKTGDGKTAHIMAEGIAVAESPLRGVYLSRPLMAASRRRTGTVAPLYNWAAIAIAHGAAASLCQRTHSSPPSMLNPTSADRRDEPCSARWHCSHLLRRLAVSLLVDSRTATATCPEAGRSRGMADYIEKPSTDSLSQISQSLRKEAHVVR
jgi:hypothetical protein